LYLVIRGTIHAAGRAQGDAGQEPAFGERTKASGHGRARAPSWVCFHPHETLEPAPGAFSEADEAFVQAAHTRHLKGRRNARVESVSYLAALDAKIVSTGWWRNPATGEVELVPDEIAATLAPSRVFQSKEVLLFEEMLRGQAAPPPQPPASTRQRFYSVDLLGER